MNLQKSKLISLVEYQSLLRKLNVETKTFYQTREWLQSLENGLNVSVNVVCSQLGDGNPVALTPFCFKRVGPIGVCGSPLRGTHTGSLGPIFLDNKADNAIVDGVIQSQHKLLLDNNHLIEWRWNKDCFQSKFVSRALAKLGYEAVPKLTNVIDLSVGQDEIWIRMEGRARNAIRKSQKLDVGIKWVKPDEEWVKSYYKMLSKVYSRQNKVSPHPFTLYQSLADPTLVKNVKFVEALHRGVRVSCAIFLVDEENLTYFSGASSQLGYKLSANSLLQWSAITMGIGLGLKAYDLGGLGISSIDKFKKSFGGQESESMTWRYRSKTYSLVEPLGMFLAERGFIKLR